MFGQLVKEMFRLWNLRYALESNGEDLFEVNVEISNVQYLVRKEMGF